MRLSNHTLKSYDDQLNQLMGFIQEMGAQVRELVLSAKAALRDRSPERAADAKARDKRINALDQQIEETATAILALQNPMAIDLRFVTSAIKSAGALERAGDLAKNIVKRSVKLEGPLDGELLSIMESMSDKVAQMIDDALEAVSARDAELALAVWKRDDEVDSLYHQFFSLSQKTLLGSPLGAPAQVASFTHLMFMAKNLERIADYATNLAKTVYYITTGSPPDKSVLKSRD